MKKILPALLGLLVLTGCAALSGAPEDGAAPPLPESTEATPEPLTETETFAEPETTEETASSTSEEPDFRVSERYTGALYDIRLRASNPEILAGEEESEIIWYAEIPADCNPQIVYLIDADTGEVAAELSDEADYEKYGDTIKGDSVYNCRFAVETELNSDPEVSGERYYHYYAEFTEGDVIHRSETKEIRVVEPFTDKELDDMQAVDEAISAMMEAPGYEELDDNERLDRAVALLKELEADGTADRPYSLIEPDSIVIDGDMVHFQYACGVGGGIKVTPFDPMMN